MYAKDSPTAMQGVLPALQRPLSDKTRRAPDLMGALSGLYEKRAARRGYPKIRPRQPPENHRQSLIYERELFAHDRFVGR